MKYEIIKQLDDHGRFSYPWGRGSAYVTWKSITPHLFFSTNRGRICLAALHYARILRRNKFLRAQLIEHVGHAANSLIDFSHSALTLPWWDVQKSRGAFTIWPWTLVEPCEIAKLKMYRSTLKGDDLSAIWLHMEEKASWDWVDMGMPVALHSVLAPASVLLALTELSAELDEPHRILLGQVLVAMNRYFGTVLDAGARGSEEQALAAALPLLLDDLSPISWLAPIHPR
jgi:hypothetical protein